MALSFSQAMQIPITGWRSGFSKNELLQFFTRIVIQHVHAEPEASSVAIRQCPSAIRIESIALLLLGPLFTPQLCIVAYRLH